MTETLSADDCLVTAISYLQRNEYALALEYLDKTLALNPESYEALTQKGIVSLQTGDHEKAIYWWKKSIEIKENTEALVNLGFYYSKLEKHQEAKPYLKRAYELSPQKKDSAIQWAFIEMLEGNFKKAENVLQELIDAEIEGYPELINENVYTMLSQVKAGTKDYQGGIAVLEGLLEKRPDSLIAVHNLAKLNQVDGNYTKANEHYQTILNSVPDNADLIKEYGTFLSTCIDPKTSINYLEEKLPLLKEDFEMQMLLALTYEKANEISKAIKAFERVAQLNPTDGRIPVKITQLQQLVDEA